MPQLGRHREWLFAHGGVRFSMPLAGRLNINNSEALIDAAVSGEGIVSRRDLPRGRRGEGRKAEGGHARVRDQGPAVSAVYLPNRHLSARVRAFLDFLATVVPEEPAWDRAVLGAAGSGASRRRAARR